MPRVKRVRSGVSRFTKSDKFQLVNAMNPFRGLTTARAQAVEDMSHNRTSPELQRIYAQLEKTDEIMIAAKRMRISSISEKPWSIVPEDDADEAEAAVQVDYIQKQLQNADGFRKAIEHLALAMFRGYAALNPVYNDQQMTQLKAFNLIDNQNLIYSNRFQKWLWNADGSPCYSCYDEESADLRDGVTYINNLPAIPEDEIVLMVEDTPIDYPALMIALRMQMSNHDWGRFVQAYGLPNIIMELPSYIKDGQETAFYESVQEMFDGGSGVVPAETKIHYGESARGVEPFSAFLLEQQKLMAKLILGGSLLLISESGTGTLAGNAQYELFQNIIRRDLMLIAETLNEQLIDKMIARKFNTRSLVKLEFDVESKRTPEQILTLAKLAKEAGYEMDQAELEAAVGFTLTKIAESKELQA